MKKTKVEMDKAELRKEHRRLVRILRHGFPKERKAEADRQDRESKEYR